jgi:hypothetical protein
MIIFAYFNSLDRKKHLSRTGWIKKYIYFETRSIYEAIEIVRVPFSIGYKVVEDYKNEMVKIGWEK